MTGQTSLFMQVRTTDPDTSHDAAHALTDLSRMRARLVETYAAHPDGLTAREAGRLAGYPEAWKRVSDLLRDAVLVDTGDRRTDPGTGRAGRVLRLAA